ncbi:MAG: MATE family efflux transporter [Desulfobacteraceae bacterium]|nr:MATE family efflux transporter [Desulfobacteraceae bacterium]
MANRLNLTTGSITGQLMRLASPILFGMLFFTLYLLIDLFFVGCLGPDAVAALSISGNAFFVHLGLSFIIGTGAMSLIAQAYGAKKFDHAVQVFKQSLILSVIAGCTAAMIGYLIAGPYIHFFGGKGMALIWGTQYFRIYSISLLFLLLLHVFSSCYRGMGDTKTPMLIMLQSLVLNIILDPVLIFGLAGFPALGVQGAAFASLISQIYGVVLYGYLVFIKKQHLHLKGPFKIDFSILKQSLAIGLPSGLAYFLLTANLLITYRVVSPYGTEALAALGIGFRIVQSIYLPSVAISEALAAMVGQNYGAREQGRVKTAFWIGWRTSSIFMLSGTIICWMFPSALIHLFSQDPNVIHYGVLYLKIVSLSNLIVGTILVVSAAFQGIGKTYPTLVCALADNLLFALAIFTLPAFFGWGISSVWWLKLSTGAMEMVLCAFWLKFQMEKMLPLLSKANY